MSLTCAEEGECEGELSVVLDSAIAEALVAVDSIEGAGLIGRGVVSGRAGVLVSGISAG